MGKRIERNSQRQHDKTFLSNTKRRGDNTARQAAYSPNDANPNWPQQTKLTPTLNQPERNPECSCGFLNETLEHYLFSCRNFSEERKYLIEACVTEKIHFPPDLHTLSKKSNTWDVLCKYVVKTKRLGTS